MKILLIKKIMVDLYYSLIYKMEMGKYRLIKINMDMDMDMDMGMGIRFIRYEDGDGKY